MLSFLDELLSPSNNGTTIMGASLLLNTRLWLTYGWLCLGALAPLVIVLTIWTLCMHATYRARWRTLDVLLAAALVQELPAALLVLLAASFKSSFVHLPATNDTQVIVSSVLVGGAIAIRFFQLALVSALVIDRAAILRWPYRYRFAIRHSQIRIFLLMLALVAVAIGGIGLAMSYLDPMATGRTALPMLDSDHLRYDGVHGKEINTMSNTTSLAPAATLPTIVFTYNLLSLDRTFSYVFLCLSLFLAFISIISFFYVECKRPRIKASATTSSAGSSNAAYGKNRYLPSIATLFTSATNSSTATSSSTSSSLSASSPPPSRFSSLANLTGHNSHHQQHHHHSQNNKTVSSTSTTATTGGSSPPATNLNAGGNYYYPSKNERTSSGAGELSSLYPISIVDMLGGTPNDNKQYASMMTTDNSLYRFIDGENRSISPQESAQHHQGNQHRQLNTSSSDPSPSSLDPLTSNATTSPRLPSFTKASNHIYSTAAAVTSANAKMAEGDLFGPMSSVASSHPHHRHSTSAFDLRWSSVIGPVAFCYSFNHGPYLVSFLQYFYFTFISSKK